MIPNWVGPCRATRDAEDQKIETKPIDQGIKSTMDPTKEGINAAGMAIRPFPRPMLGIV
jgi:hypothetical protein